MTRYDRQTRLPEIGPEGQKRLLHASVLCVGAGGLGSPALLYLAAAGIGRIGIIDFDRVDLSNLQRQILFSTQDFGQEKVLAAKERLQSLNPEITIEVYDEHLDAQAAERLFPLYDLILDGSDNFETKFLINDAAVKFGKPWIYGAIQGFDGQASVFNTQDGPCYRCLYPELPKTRIANCAEAGVIGAVAGMIGITQALQAIQMIVGHESFEPLAGKLWVIDTKTLSTRTLTLRKDPLCPVCSLPKDDIRLTYAPRVCAIAEEITTIQLLAKTNPFLIDVREEDEWEQGHIAGATLWPLSRLVNGDVPALPRDREIILYCQKGIRSMHALHILKAKGYEDILSLSGGYEDWLENF